MATWQPGMSVGAPDILTTIHATYNGPYTDLGVGPMPGETATMVGGSGYMFNKNDTPAQIQAGIKFIDYEFMTPGQGQFNYKGLAATGRPWGWPGPERRTGATATSDAAVMATYANIPTSNFTAYVAALPTMKLVVEPPQAQAIYAQGDKAMDTVLTNPNANLQQLLDTFKSETDSILSNAQQ